MKDERAWRSDLCAALSALEVHTWPVETDVSLGVGDVFFAGEDLSGWLELKVIKHLTGTEAVFKETIKLEQANFLDRAQWGGTYAAVVGVYEGRYATWPAGNLMLKSKAGRIARLRWTGPLLSVPELYAMLLKRRPT
jgi:hypothetical protein